jgi:hypothetical protein
VDVDAAIAAGLASYRFRPPGSAKSESPGTDFDRTWRGDMAATLGPTIVNDTVVSFEINPGTLLQFLGTRPEGGPRLKCAEGGVTLVAPGKPHETAGGRIASLVLAVCLELRIKHTALESTTWTLTGRDAPSPHVGGRAEAVNGTGGKRTGARTKTSCVDANGSSLHPKRSAAADADQRRLRQDGERKRDRFDRTARRRPDRTDCASRTRFWGRKRDGRIEIERRSVPDRQRSVVGGTSVS